jgi:DNA-binding transcriptional LysR family regulator
MEMHQDRYFLAAAAEQSFTKAAEKCNVAQPSLTRAIKQLEGELGGDLFRRERPQTQLTELGERMHPLMKQIYDSALGARSLASSIKTGELGSLRLALSHAVELDLLVAHIGEVSRLLARLELKLLRGTAAEVLELLKNGEAELALASDLGEQWERLDRWPLFNESFRLVVCGSHSLASRGAVDISELQEEPILQCRHSEHAEQTATLLRASNLAVDHGAPSTSTGWRAASARRPPPRSSRCCGRRTGHATKVELQLFSAASRSSMAMRLRKSGSTNRAFIRPSVPTTNVAGMGNIHESLPWKLGRSRRSASIFCISAPIQIAKFRDNA